MLKECEYFTDDKSYCNLVCPILISNLSQKAPKEYDCCKDCGYNLLPNDKCECK